jgi:hypothetical protein
MRTTEADPKYCLRKLHSVNDDPSRKITDLKEHKNTTEKECNSLCSFFDEYASAQATHSAERKLVKVDG